MDRSPESRPDAPADDTSVRETLDRHDRDRALGHALDRLAPSRGAHWPKHDQRSSSRLAGLDGRGPADERR